MYEYYNNNGIYNISRVKLTGVLALAVNIQHSVLQGINAFQTLSPTAKFNTSKVSKSGTTRQLTDKQKPAIYICHITIRSLLRPEHMGNCQTRRDQINTRSM
jgi:hypothetical protein